MVTNTNISTLTGLNFTRKNGLGISQVLERLSTGLRINKGADDPSGLSISKGMTGWMRGLNVATQNAQDGISLVHTMDGALAETHDMLMRMRDLSLRSANEATLTSSDRSKLQAEVSKLASEITRSAEATTFNTKQILVGDTSDSGKWDVKQITSVGTDGRVSLSGDGNKIAFYTFTGTGDLYTQNTDGSGLTFLANTPGGGGMGPSISGDGNKVVFIQNMAGPIYSINSDGTNLTQLTTDPTGLPGPTVKGKPVTYDGSKVVYSKLVGGNVDIYIQNTDGTGEVRLTTDAAMDGDAVISADGSKVAFISQRTGDNEIYVVNSDGTGETRITFNVGLDGIHSISGDGSKIAFVSDMGGAQDIYIINSDGTGLQQLTTGGGGWAAISDDGSKIAYINAAGELHLMNSDGSNNELVSTIPGVTSELSVSSDGKKIAFVSSGSQTYLASFEADTTNAPNIQVGPDAETFFTIGVEQFDARASALGVAYLNVISTSGAKSAVDYIDTAIEYVSEYRAKIGQLEMRIAHAVDDLAAEYINVSASLSLIEDADMAVEISEFTRVQIMAQSNQAALAQANATPQALLQLLR